MPELSVEQKRFENDRIFKVVDSFSAWIKMVTTSFSAFLGVLLALDSHRVAAESSSRMFGSVCVSVVVSMFLGFVSLGVEPVLVALVGKREAAAYATAIQRSLPVMIVILLLWILSVLVTFGLMIALIVRKYFN